MYVDVEIFFYSGWCIDLLAKEAIPFQPNDILYPWLYIYMLHRRCVESRRRARPKIGVNVRMNEDMKRDARE